MRLTSLLMISLLLGLGACATAAENDYDLDPEQYPPLDDKADTAARMVLSDAPRGTLSYGDAAWMAYFSKISYYGPEEFEAAAKLVEPQARVSWWFSLSGAAYYVETPSADILVIRGSDDAGDWVANINTDPWNDWYGSAPKGFSIQLRNLLDEPHTRGGQTLGMKLVDYVALGHRNKHTKRLYVTGHSMGAALATLMYVVLELDGCRERKELPADPLTCGRTSTIPVHALYTFGAPRAASNKLGRLAGSPLVSGGTTAPVYRFVNRGDMVTRVPDDLRYEHPSDPHAGKGVDGELKYLIHMGDSGIVRGALEGDYPANTRGDHAIVSYLLGIRDRYSPSRD